MKGANQQRRRSSRRPTESWGKSELQHSTWSGVTGGLRARGLCIRTVGVGLWVGQLHGLVLLMCAGALAATARGSAHLPLSRSSTLEATWPSAVLTSSELLECVRSAHHPGSSLTTITASNVSLIVNPRPEALCCGEKESSNTSVGLCLSIAAAALVDKNDAVCRNDPVCSMVNRFFQDMSWLTYCQITTVSLAAGATGMWLGCLFCARAGTKNTTSRISFAIVFALWFLCSMGTIITICIQLKIIYSNDLIGIAETIKSAKCHQWPDGLGYSEVISNLRSTRILLFGELAVSVMALLIGLYSVSQVFGKEEASFAPMMLETVLLLIEDGIAVGGLIYLLSATNEVIVRTNNASCSNVNASTEGAVTGCVTTLPINGSSFEYRSSYRQKCGRKSPHVYANLAMGGFRHKFFKKVSVRYTYCIMPL